VPAAAATGSAHRTAPDDDKTRARLIDAAGRVIADVGFDRALGRDIAAAAGTNPAAINYHFGGRDRLYRAVLLEAEQRLVTVDQIREVRRRGGSPAQTLRDVIALAVRNVAGREGWHFSVILREIAAPTAVLDELFAEELAPKMVEVLAVVAAVMALPHTHPAVRRGMVSLASQIAFLFQNRYMLGKLLPGLNSDPAVLAELEEHMYEFTLAGLKATAKSARA
jgi:AcrR family transcriptional regulator